MTNIQFPSPAQILAQHQLTGDTVFSHRNGESHVQWPKCSCRDWSDHPVRHPNHLADMLREARTVTTIGQLDSLPVGVVVVDARGFIFEQAEDADGEVLWWFQGAPNEATEIALPARLLDHPGWWS